MHTKQKGFGHHSRTSQQRQLAGKALAIANGEVHRHMHATQFSASHVACTDATRPSESEDPRVGLLSLQHCNGTGRPATTRTDKQQSKPIAFQRVARCAATCFHQGAAKRSTKETCAAKRSKEAWEHVESTVPDQSQGATFWQANPRTQRHWSPKRPTQNPPNKPSHLPRTFHNRPHKHHGHTMFLRDIFTNTCNRIRPRLHEKNGKRGTHRATVVGKDCNRGRVPTGTSSGEPNTSSQNRCTRANCFFPSPKVQARGVFERLVCCALPYLPLGTWLIWMLRQKTTAEHV